MFIYVDRPVVNCLENKATANRKEVMCPLILYILRKDNANE